MKVEITLTKQQALAVLKSEGFSNGWGVKKSIALQEAEMRIIGAIQSQWNSELGEAGQ